MSEDTAFTELVAAIEEASLRPELWQEVCERIGAALLRLDRRDGVMRPLDLWQALAVDLQRAQAELRELAPLGAAEMEFLDRLTPHLDRAVRVAMRLKEAEAQARAADAIVDRLPHAIILTDAAGRVRSMNLMAQAILAEADGLVLRGGTLGAQQRHEAAELSRLIREAGGGGPRPSGAMQITRRSQRRPLPVLVTPIRGGDAVFSRRLAVCITVADPDRPPELPADLLARLYDFTPREAEVAARLLRGETPQQAAEQLGMTMNTVRTHIRHLLLKTDTERLPELIRLLLRTPPIA